MIAARANNATCGSTDLWMRNAQGDDPCKVASMLLGMCESTGVYNIPPVSLGLYYPPPSKQQANACQCNTVAYSLMSACAVCQNGTYSNFISWTSNCSSALVVYKGYPNQTTSNLKVPSYAFLPLTSNNQFDIGNANAAATELTMSASSSLASASTTTFFPSTASAATTTTLIAASPSSATSSSSAMGMNLEIVIAVVVVFTLLLILAGFFLFSRYRRGNSHRYQSVTTQHNRPIESMSSKNPDTRHEAKTFGERSVSVRMRLVSYFRRPRKTPQVYSYEKIQLPKHGVENTPPLKPRSVQPYRNEAKIVEQRPVSIWTMILSNLGLQRNPTQPSTSQTAHYEKVQLPVETTPPSKVVPQMQMPMPAYNGKPTSVPATPHQPTLRSPRPQPTRIDTLPILQSISRARPQPRRSYSSSLPTTSSTPRDGLPAHRPPEGVKNIPRPADFKIEDTPTTTDGNPTWKRKRPPVRRDFFNPEIGGSMSSLGSFGSPSAHMNTNADEDSDSVLLISRSGDKKFDVASISSQARSVAPSFSKRSFSDTSVDDSSRSMAGSTIPPVSPAVFNGYDASPVSVRYGTPEVRRQLFPAVVRAAGYTGLPHNNPQG